jgi:TatD DNase family protein
MSTLQLVDSHVHLDRYTDSELREMLGRARAAGVVRFLSVGVDLASSRAAIQLAHQHTEIDAAVGLHPSAIARVPDAMAMLGDIERLAADPSVVAIGEVGLDASVGPLDHQLPVFRAALQLAKTRDLGVVLHIVDAHDTALAMLRANGPIRAVVHYFVGRLELARRYLEAGCWISVGKPAMRPEHRSLRAAVRRMPIERLLVETDTYPLPGRSTAPSDIADIARRVAELRRMPIEELATETTSNYARFIGRL